MLRKFIPFKTEAEKEQEKRQESLKNEIINKIISMCGDSSELENELKNEFNVYTLKRLVTIINKDCDSILKSINQYNVSLNTIVPKKDNLVLSAEVRFNGFNPTIGITKENQEVSKNYLDSAKSVDEQINKAFAEKLKNSQQNRVLDNGGLAPPVNNWKSLSQIELSNSDKKNLVEEMKSLHVKGITVNKKTFHHKTPINMEEFTEPFLFLESMHDYNGSFIVTLLRNKLNVSSQAITNGIDLSGEIQNCIDNKNILISIYDINGSTLNNEHKRFAISLSFDSIHGILKYDKAIFSKSSKDSQLTNRQIEEIKKFCNLKKISYGTIC